MSTQAHPIAIPVAPTPYPDNALHLDNDDPNYIVGDAAIYMTLALAYDSLAGPGHVVDERGVGAPDYTTMQPRLATGWRPDTNNSWLVQLRQARSHAGNILDSTDMVWRFDKCFGTEQTLGSWRWGACVGLEGVDALDDREARFRLRARLEHFPNWLLSVTPNVVDSKEIVKHATDADPWGIEWSNRNVAGFGAYTFTGTDAADMRFEPRPDYWMGPPPPNPVELIRVQDRATAIELLDGNWPAVLIGARPDEVARLRERDDLVVDQVWAGHTSVEINFTLEPFDDVRVRQALAFATPYPEIIERGLLGFGRPWRSPVKGTSQWYEPGFWRYDRDLAHARALLRAAGCDTGIAVEFYLPQRPDCVRVAEILRDAWRLIGVEVELRPMGELRPGVDPPLRLRTECSHNLCEPMYDLAHDYAVLDPIAPKPSIRTGVGTWHPLWQRNETAVQLLGSAMLESDPRRKRATFMELQRYLVGFSSSIFLAESMQSMVCTTSVPRAFYTPDTRFYQAMQYQNAGTRYVGP